MANCISDFFTLPRADVTILNILMPEPVLSRACIEVVNLIAEIE
jgi:hypothetical protein